MCAAEEDVTLNHKRSFISIVLASIVLVSLCAVYVSSASVSAAGDVGGTNGAKTAGVASSQTLRDSTGGKTPELSWTKGQPYPVVDGRTIYPTLAPPKSAPAVDTHWYAGGVFSSTATARTIGVTIRVPDRAPVSDEFYYVLLSAWDSAGSYDQLGFSGNYGTWGLTYSWTSGSPSNPTYHYDPNAMALTPGATYTFNITTDAGVTHFDAHQGSTQVWTLDASTGGNNLVLAGSYAGYYDYTDYEEVWVTHAAGGSPAFDFYFYDNYYVTTGGVRNAPTWTVVEDSGAPSGVAVKLSGNTVLVDNPGGGWSPWTSVGGNIKGAPAASGWAPYGVSKMVFARYANDQLYERSYEQIDNVWGPWTSLGGTLTSGPASTSFRAGYMYVYARGTTGALYARWTGDGADTWTPWYQPIVGSNLLAGTGPAVCSAAADTQDLVATGANGALYWSHWTLSTGYKPWTNLGGKLTSSPAIVSMAPGYLQVYGRGNDGALWSRWSGDGGATWTQWYKPIPGSLLAGTGAAASSSSAGTQETFVTGMNSALYWSHGTFSYGASNFRSIGGTLTSSPASTYSDGLIEVFARGANGAVWMTAYYETVS